MHNEEVAQEEREKLLREWFVVGQEIVHPYTNKKVVVAGFNKRCIFRGGIGHKLAGVYLNLFNLRVLEEHASEEWLWVDVNLVRNFLYHINERPADRLRKMSALNIRVGDLPDTPFWVGDVVWSEKTGGVNSVVHSINYQTHTYEVATERLVRNWFAEKDLVLVEHGNVWKLEHGEPLVFQGESEQARLMEEARFWKSLGMSRKLLHKSGTKENNDLWHLWAGIQRLQSGKADQLIVKDKTTQQVVLIKYDNTEFGDRMRKHALGRFGFDIAETPPSED